MVNTNPHNCREELKNASLKVTPARLGVLKVLENSTKPIDVESVASYLKKHDIKVDPVTVFRIINIFTDRGLAKPIQLNEGKFRYEYGLKEDHHHFVCESCGTIEDISDCNIGELEMELQQRKGFMVMHHSLEFFGLCKKCQR